MTYSPPTVVPAPSYVQGWGFQPRLLAGEALLFSARSLCGLGGSIEIGWKGTRDRRVAPKNLE